MKERVLDLIHCPKCGSHFNVKERVEKKDEIYSAILFCSLCLAEYRVVNYIPRLIDGYNYSDSWGKLWRETGQVVLDSYTGIPFYHDVIHGKYSQDGQGRDGYSPFGFEWPKDLRGQLILEVGPGTGCCTEHLIKTGAHLVSIDMSNAIDTFSEDILTMPNIDVVQGDINKPIFENGIFDKIWLFQVLQHTPSPVDTLKTMYRLLKKNGEIAFTSYAAVYKPWFLPIIQRIHPQTSWKLINWFVPVFIPLKYGLQKVFYKFKMPFMAKVIRKITEPIDPRNIFFNAREGYAGDYPHGKLWESTHDKKLLMKYVIINTFDCITPQYVNGANHQQIELWASEAAFSSIRTWGVGGVRATAFK